MKKFGFGKKGDDADDTNRSALFGRKKQSQTQSDNPYAQQGASDPYADNTKYANISPYQEARSGLGTNEQHAGFSNGQGGRPSTYGSSPQNQTSERQHRDSASTGYGSDRYGSGGGYGSNRYNSPAGAARGPGGYGGFGRVNNEPDDNRDSLFAGVQERRAEKQQATSTPTPYGVSGSDNNSYGGYGEQRELTEEEQQEADYQAILAEKRQIQQESASSVSRSVQMARQANEVGQATLARLGAQGERLQNTEKNLDLAANQNKIAQDRAAELKTLNGSMFAVHVKNPFTSKQRKQKADDEVLNRHRAEREQREATRHEGYSTNLRMETTFKEIESAGRVRPQARKKDYGKFNLDDEEGADELEDQIDDGLTELEGQVSMMNMVGKAIGKEVDSQNKQIDRIMGKSDAVDDATRMNRERLARIK
ncbi:Protein transport protein S9 plasma membrane t-SNARE [Conoideocrella luteorostrata]|uniref:Protein transport protein S9 plasma membrane t-SNARE n=1 Tax=Conoideocrella luteorostrata TaxID=1105319 RepID=A0AAJ0G1C2_9HYPO|nr:Protein transport protein S9 plasma membrane t-SNARE [Conoideocrella luteorostrata]